MMVSQTVSSFMSRLNITKVILNVLPCIGKDIAHEYTHKLMAGLSRLNLCSRNCLVSIVGFISGSSF